MVTVMAMMVIVMVVLVNVMVMMVTVMAKMVCDGQDYGKIVGYDSLVTVML